MFFLSQSKAPEVFLKSIGLTGLVVAGARLRSQVPRPIQVFLVEHFLLCSAAPVGFDPVNEVRACIGWVPAPDQPPASGFISVIASICSLPSSAEVSIWHGGGGSQAGF